MEKAFIKFCQQINFEINDELKDSIIKKVNLTEKNNKPITEFEIHFFSIPTKEKLNEFFEKSSSFFLPSQVEFNLFFQNRNYSKERIKNLIEFGCKIVLDKNINDFIDENSMDFNINENTFLLKFNSLLELNNFNQNIDLEKIKNFFNLDDLKFKIHDDSKWHFEQEMQKENENNKNEFNKLISQKYERNKIEQTKPQSFSQFKNNKKVFKILMEDFYTTEEKYLSIEGKIFNIEKIITKTKLTITMISITDGTEAIVAKYFLREGDKNIFDWLKIDMYICVSGEKKQEYNSTSSFLQVNNIEKIEKDIVKDKSDKKRIEFSVRSSMSAMDGFISAEEFMKHAKTLGHDAIGFVDHQNIQAFPDIYSNAKKIGIKPLYGTTFSVISKKHNLIWNTKINLEINKEKYVIFDLETTSLNPRQGEIIEFGAVIIENNLITKIVQFFVKPSKQISSFTSELTGITQKMLDTEAKYDNQKDAINEILNIFSDYTLVAHNAQFDIGFIKEKMLQYNLGTLKNQIIDTMGIAKVILPNSYSYRLEIVSKKLNIVYDPTVAHRADYDAKILQQVWQKMIFELEQIKIKTFEDINNINLDILNEKKYDHDIAVYAKNQKGLKKLFKLMSKSLTKSYFNGPRLFEDDLIDRDDLLVGPASTNSRLIDLMQTGTNEEIDKEIDKWDFIGIPSPHLFSHLISRGNFSSEELKTMLKELVLKAIKANKIVIAIGDVRYIDSNDCLSHSIYINTKGLEGKRHPLYKYNEINPDYPKQYFLTTNEMIQQFEFLNSEDLVYKIVVENTQLLNSMIDDNIEIIKSKLYPPKFDNSETKLVELVYENAYKTYGKNLPEIVEKRIKRELEPINKYGFSVVYWISQKLVSKSLNDGYLVGSRGSVGSSIVATLSKITEVNPLPPHYICKNCQYVEFVNNPKTSSGFDLPTKNCPKCDNKLNSEGQTIPFETFLGFDGDKIPDIDLNFSGDYQPIIHQEVRNLFGENHTFRAGTISTVAEKTAFGYVKKYFEEKNIDKSNIFVNYLAKKIEGSKRTTGQHPGGIIIIPKEFDVEDFTPVNYPANDLSSNWKTTHFDFHAIHDNVLKLDLLGHDDPTAIKLLQKFTNVKISDISFSDEKIMKLFSSTEPLGILPKDINNEPTGVLGIPEFGTKFVRKMLNVAKPTSFNDLINISGLSHGTDVWSGNAEELIKQGKTLNEVISCRDDIMIYLMNKGIEPLKSFQIMEKVRKGQGLNEDDEKILTSKGIEKWYINSLNKIKYMFPKAHATAYVMMAWRIAWFKVYYPMEYYATFFTVRSDVFDFENSIGTKSQIEKRLIELERKKHNGEKITPKEEELITTFEIINEMYARGFSISNIDLYESDATEWKINYENKQLIPPFIVLDGLGDTAAKSIIEARNNKKFTSKVDLASRTQINKTVLEKMDKFGILANLSDTDQIKLF